MTIISKFIIFIIDSIIIFKIYFSTFRIAMILYSKIIKDNNILLEIFIFALIHIYISFIGFNFCQNHYIQIIPPKRIDEDYKANNFLYNLIILL